MVFSHMIASKILLDRYMNKLILVNGDLATGKTHLALIIRDRFNLLLFTKDGNKEFLSETHPYKTFEENQKLSAMAVDMLYDSFENAAKEHKDVILEANFREKHMEKLQELVNKYHYEVLHLDLIGNINILYHRYMNRIQNENRHPTHVVNKLDDFVAFEVYNTSRRGEKKIGKIITINADDFSYQTDEKLFKEIENFLRS